VPIQARLVNSRSRPHQTLIPNSGPAVGMSQMYTNRIRELESALNFLLGIPEVMTKVESLVRVRGPVSAFPEGQMLRLPGLPASSACRKRTSFTTFNSVHFDPRRPGQVRGEEIGRPVPESRPSTMGVGIFITSLAFEYIGKPTSNLESDRRATIGLVMTELSPTGCRTLETR
jgi:hypothetical protein